MEHRVVTKPLGPQVAHDLMCSILTGEIRPGENLPTEGSLCRKVRG